jgi:hypothetical protein
MSCESCVSSWQRGPLWLALFDALPAVVLLLKPPAMHLAGEHSAASFSIDKYTAGSCWLLGEHMLFCVFVQYLAVVIKFCPSLYP